jgi:SAM-dependent methyltransferase
MRAVTDLLDGVDTAPGQDSLERLPGFPILNMMRFRGVDTTAVEHPADVRAFFDRCAEGGFQEQHGRPARLLAYRLGLIRRHARLRPEDVVLDVGCGNGHHLLALAPEIAGGVGVDLSPRMIDLARRSSPKGLRFLVDDATRLEAVASSSVDLVLCIGALEHMVDRPAALASMHRVLRPRGRLFCLTPDGAHPWYRSVAPRLGIATRHLSTDHFLTGTELESLLEQAGFARVELGGWSFIPRGDMPALARWLFGGLDGILRGGLWACAWK